MRLLFVSSEFPPGPGGIGTHAYQVSRNLARLGWEVAVVSSQDYAPEDEITSFNQAQPFPIERLRPVSFAPVEAIYRWRVLSRWIKKWGPDIVLASGTRSIWLVAFLARIMNFRWVAIGHGSEFKLPAAWQHRLVRWSFQRACSVVCVSQYTWRRMLEAKIKPRAGTVIPNGADGEQFRILPLQESNDCASPEQLQGQRLLVTVGSVTERKGQDVVIRALPHVLKRVPNTHYLIAGMPERKLEFSRLARELGIAEHVHFLGRVQPQELVRLLNRADVFLMTSKHTPDGDFEGYGIAVTEAALCGKPAIVSNNSGLTEAIVPGETGFGVPENDEHAAAKAILSLLEDDGLRRRMGEAAQKRALAESTWEHRAKEFDALLRNLIRTPAVARARDFSEATRNV
jgi:phosphatidylinositol alpha-1,6-mannosyltransferase